MARDTKLRVVLGADISKFKTGMSRAGTELKKFDKKFGGLLGKMSRSLPIAAAVAGAAMVAMSAKVAKWGDDIAKQSKALSVSTEFLSEMDFVAQRAGASMGDITKSIGLLAKAALDAEDGLATYVRAFARLGVDIHQGNGELKTTEALFMDVIKALKGVENGTERLGLAKQVLGRGGASLLPLIDEDIEGLRKLSKELGRSLTAEQAKQAEKFADAMLNVKSGIEGLVIAATSDKAGGAIGFLNSITDIIIKYNKARDYMGKFKAYDKQGVQDYWYPPPPELGQQPGMYESDWGKSEPKPWEVPKSAYSGLQDEWSTTKITSIGDTMKVLKQGAPFEPIIKDISKVNKGLYSINTEMEKVNKIVIVGEDVWQSWRNQASLAADVTTNFASDFYSSMKSGEGALASFGNAFKRLAEDIIFQLIRMKTYGFVFDTLSGVGNLKSGGSTGPDIEWPAGYEGLGGGQGNVSVVLNNNSGTPLDVGSANISTGTDGQTQIDLMINSSLSRQAGTGRLDNIMRMYGGRRQGVNR